MDINRKVQQQISRLKDADLRTGARARWKDMTDVWLSIPEERRPTSWQLFLDWMKQFDSYIVADTQPTGLEYDA